MINPILKAFTYQPPSLLVPALQPTFKGLSESLSVEVRSLEPPHTQALRQKVVMPEGLTQEQQKDWQKRQLEEKVEQLRTKICRFAGYSAGLWYIGGKIDIYAFADLSFDSANAANPEKEFQNRLFERIYNPNTLKWYQKIWLVYARIAYRLTSSLAIYFADYYSKKLVTLGTQELLDFLAKGDVNLSFSSTAPQNPTYEHLHRLGRQWLTEIWAHIRNGHGLIAENPNRGGTLEQRQKAELTDPRHLAGFSVDKMYSELTNLIVNNLFHGLWIVKFFAFRFIKSLDLIPQIHKAIESSIKDGGDYTPLVTTVAIKILKDYQQEFFGLQFTSPSDKIIPVSEEKVRVIREHILNIFRLANLCDCGTTQEVKVKVDNESTNEDNITPEGWRNNLSLDIAADKIAKALVETVNETMVLSQLNNMLDSANELMSIPPKLPTDAEKKEQEEELRMRKKRFIDSFIQSLPIQLPQSLPTRWARKVTPWLTSSDDVKLRAHLLREIHVLRANIKQRIEHVPPAEQGRVLKEFFAILQEFCANRAAELAKIQEKNTRTQEKQACYDASARLVQDIKNELVALQAAHIANKDTPIDFTQLSLRLDALSKISFQGHLWQVANSIWSGVKDGAVVGIGRDQYSRYLQPNIDRVEKLLKNPHIYQVAAMQAITMACQRR